MLLGGSQVAVVVDVKATPRLARVVPVAVAQVAKIPITVQRVPLTPVAVAAAGVPTAV